MNTNSSLGLRIALGILLVVALLLAAAVVLALMRNLSADAQPPARGAVLWQGGQETSTLEAAETQATARARAWASDVTLVRADGAWRPGQNWKEVELPPVAWTFSYYSRSEGKLVSVSVSDDEVFWGSPHLIPAPPPALARFPPQSGPEVAWVAFRAAGGDSFLQAHPQAQIGLRLVQDGGMLKWRVSAIDGKNSSLVWINAETGVLINAQ